MKKQLLLGLALCATGIASQAATHNIYVVNDANWSELALYCWGTSEIFGVWPGTTDYTSETINGVTYAHFTIDGHDGDSANLILNNNNNGAQIDLASITLDAENYYYATNGKYVVTVDPENPDIKYPDPATLYALDETGWGALYVYGWAENQPEIFGGWPGAALTETETIADITFKKTAFAGSGIDYNLIFNNNDGTQVDGLTVPAGEDVYIKVTADKLELMQKPGVEYVKIYIEDKTGWENLYVYAWADGGLELFGGWPGILATETETVNDVTYKVLTAEKSETAWNFIFNDGASTQYDAATEVMDHNIFIVANPTGATSGVTTITDTANEEAAYFTLSGVRVENPSAGIYVCRKGSEVKKIVIR